MGSVFQSFNLRNVILLYFSKPLCLSQLKALRYFGGNLFKRKPENIEQASSGLFHFLFGDGRTTYDITGPTAKVFGTTRKGSSIHFSLCWMSNVDVFMRSPRNLNWFDFKYFLGTYTFCILISLHFDVILRFIWALWNTYIYTHIYSLL